ncbi:hypothetical protein CPT_Scapp_045 [Serratia phage Scapp]|uniref:Lipoprotein n=1 Tax=Serratia phage Scapp TaxID=2282409 RepID=A0A345L6S2_9CAUD|nr:hypothetical protein PP898_gp45 [Serratia phage Scapp]AXH50974.1 hypothetical protein CPT_Scapp_045 [Serratia phage Scapp]
MKRWQALVIATAAVIGCSHVGTVGATSKPVEMKCDAHSLTISGNRAVYGGVAYENGSYVNMRDVAVLKFWRFDMSSRLELVILKNGRNSISTATVYDSRGRVLTDGAVCEYVD